MELDAPTAAAYVGHAFGQMLAAADRLGDDGVNVRPHGPTTNSVAALVAHCCGVTEWWLGHVALGEPSDRDRDAEFHREATVAELHELVSATLTRVGDHLARIEAGDGLPGHPLRAELPGDGESDTSVILHVLEELYQHLGHIQLTVDALTLA
jgi:hypothetical protein